MGSTRRRGETFRGIDELVRHECFSSVCLVLFSRVRGRAGIGAGVWLGVPGRGDGHGERADGRGDPGVRAVHVLAGLRQQHDERGQHSGATVSYLLLRGGEWESTLSSWRRLWIHDR